MKKSIFSFILLNLFSAGVYSQSINFDNIPSAGETYQFSSDTIFVSPGDSGNNASWDFSSLSFPPELVQAENYILPNQTNSSSSFPNANLVEGSVADTNLTFYRVAGNSYEILGFEFGTTKSIFTNSLKLANLPFSFGSSLSDNFSGTLPLGAFSADIEGTASSICDGLGQLSLPGAPPVLALRIKSQINQNTSLPLFGNILQSFTTQYNWYDPTTKNYIFSVSKDSTITSFPGATDTSVVSFSSNLRLTTIPYTNTSSIIKHGILNTVELFPNPSFGKARVIYSAKQNELISINVFDVSGKLIHSIYETASGNSSNIEIETNNWEKGVYIVQFTQDKYQATKKLIVR